MIPNPFNSGALLKVTLDGDAKLALGKYADGYYTLNSIDNGKPSWIQVEGSSSAIWYNEKYKNWMLGPKEKLWTDACSLASKDDAKRPEEATKWMYFTDNGGLMPTSNIFGSLGMY